MTKTQVLEYLGDRWYGTIVGSGDKERKRKCLCSAFVVAALMEKPATIAVIVSDAPVENALHLKVQRQGYYRWSWRTNDDSKEYGMTLAAEDVLFSMFPDENDIRSLSVWVTFKVLK